MSELCYGQLGRLDYDSDSHAWLPDRCPRLESIEAVSPVTTHIESSSTTAEQDRAGRQSLARCFLHTGASLGYLRELVKYDLKESNRDQAVGSPNGDCLASVEFGPTGNAQTGTLFAFARGIAGEEVGIVVAQSTHSGWSSHKNYVLQTTSPLQKDLCVWNPGHGQVRQILLCAYDEGSRKSLIAIRYPSAFIIGCVAGRPGWVKEASSTSGWRPSPTARMDFNVIGRCMDLKTTRNMTDLTFNPWDTSQIATAHGDGSINIWTMPLRWGRKHDADAVSQTMTPSHTLRAANDQDLYGDVDKSWTKILWTGNAVYIVALSRWKVFVYHITTGEAFEQTYQTVQEGEAVIDAKLVPSEPTHLVLVTNSRLLWLALEVQGTGTLSAHQRPYLSPLTIWKHCRDPADFTLKVTFRQSVSAQTSDADAVNLGVKTKSEGTRSAIEVLITSRLTHLTTLYTFELGTSNEPSKLISAFDPAPWCLPTLTPTAFLADVLTFNCLFVEDDGKSKDFGNGPGTGQEFLERDYDFSQIFTLDEHFSLSSTIVCHRSTAAKDTQELQKLDWSHSLPSVESKKRKYRKNKKNADPFIVDEEESQSVDGGGEFTRAILSSFRCLGQPSNHETSTDIARTVSNAAAYELLHQDSSRNRKQLSSTLRGFANGIDSTTDQSKRPGTLWQSIHNTAPKLDDIEAADAALMHLTAPKTSQANTDDQVAALEPVGMSMSNMLQDAEKRSPNTPFSDLYQQCVENWLAPLSSAFPGATRLARERILRDVTTAMCLSNWRVVSDPHVNSIETQLEVEDGANDSPPSSPAQFALPTPPQTSQIESAPSSLPLPTARTTAPSRQTSNSVNNPVNAALTRLSRFCNIPATTDQAPQSPILQNVLASWSVPTDRTSTSTPMTSQLDTSNPPDQRPRPKRQRALSSQGPSAFDQHKRQRLYDQEQNRTYNQNHNQPLLTSASSPPPPPTRTTHTYTLTPQQTQQEQSASLGISLSQNPAGTQDRLPAAPMVASQVEAGRFGGRSVGVGGGGGGLPVRKKLRKPGF